MQKVRIDSFNVQNVVCKKCGKEIGIIIGNMKNFCLKNEEYNNNGLCNECAKRSEQ